METGIWDYDNLSLDTKKIVNMASDLISNIHNTKIVKKIIKNGREEDYELNSTDKIILCFFLSCLVIPSSLSSLFDSDSKITIKRVLDFCEINLESIHKINNSDDYKKVYDLYFSDIGKIVEN